MRHVAYPSVTVLLLWISLELVGFVNGVQNGGTRCPSSDSKGREFVVAFMETMSSTVDPELNIIGSSARPTRVTIHSPRNPDLSLSISHESLVKVIRDEGPSSSGVLITADNDITVYGVEEGNSMDSFLALPTDALGREYYVASYSISTRLTRDQRKSQFTLVGVIDDTVVDITLSGHVEYQGRMYRSGEQLRVTLDRLQVIHLASEDDDLTGTRIVATRNIGVLSGSKCTDVPVNMRYCDHLVEMIPPVKSWGMAYITSPLYGRTYGDAFRILAARNNTTIKVSSHGRATLQAGQFYEIEILSNSSSTITGDKPFLVVQYSLGGDADQTSGDPFMMLVPSVEQFFRNTVFYTIKSTYSHQLTNYANVIIECQNVRGLQHNLFEIPISQFSRLNQLRHTLDGREYCTAQMMLADGVHFLRHTNPEVRFSLTLYGMGASSGTIAYGMPAGLRLPDLACKSVTPVHEDTSTVFTPETYKPTPRCPSAKVGLPDPNISPPPVGSSVNETPTNSTSGKYLSLAVFVALFSLVTILVLVVYIIILRRRISKLEAERKTYSRFHMSPVVVGADGYIGLDGSQHPERDYMTLNNPQGVWRLGRVRRTGRSPAGVPYVANAAINTNSNGISHISEPVLLPNNRNSVNGDASGRKRSAPDSFTRTLSMDNSHALRFTRRHSSNDAVSVNSQPSGNNTTDSPPVESRENQHGLQTAPEVSAKVTRKQSFQELHDIAECPDKEPPPRSKHLVRSVSQPSYQTSLKTHAPNVYYSVPKNSRARILYDRPRKRSSSVEEACPVIFSMKESLLKHDDGYMSMRDHRTSVSSQGSSNVSLSSSPVAVSPPDAPCIVEPDEAAAAAADAVETDSTDYTELF